MLEIKDGTAVIEFKKRTFANDAQNCIGLAMEMLNLSKGFKTLLTKGRTPGKKMNKTGRIRTGIQQLVNKTGVDSVVVDNLIRTIREGGLRTIKVQVEGEKEIELLPNNDVPGVIANLMVKKMI
jgi:hypothetical protein